MCANTRPPTGPTILVVDDDPVIRFSYAEALRGAGYQTLEAADGQEAVALVLAEQPALILLDVTMPVMNGWQTLAQLQTDGWRAPVVMLTGSLEVEDRVRGLGAGADDYLCKPCDRRELLARVNAVLRRSRPPVTAGVVLRFGDLTVDLANRAALRAGVPVGLTRTEFAVLEYFSTFPGQLVTRERLLEAVWGYPKGSNTRTVETHIWRLRQKLGDEAAEPRWIRTVPGGAGYRMTSDPLAA